MSVGKVVLVHPSFLPQLHAKLRDWRMCAQWCANDGDRSTTALHAAQKIMSDPTTSEDGFLARATALKDGIRGTFSHSAGEEGVSVGVVGQENQGDLEHMLLRTTQPTTVEEQQQSNHNQVVVVVVGCTPEPDLVLSSAARTSAASCSVAGVLLPKTTRASPHIHAVASKRDAHTPAMRRVRGLPVTTAAAPDTPTNGAQLERQVQPAIVTETFLRVSLHFGAWCMPEDYSLCAAVTPPRPLLPLLAGTSAERDAREEKRDAAVMVEEHPGSNSLSLLALCARHVTPAAAAEVQSATCPRPIKRKRGEGKSCHEPPAATPKCSAATTTTDDQDAAHALAMMCDAVEVHTLLPACRIATDPATFLRRCLPHQQHQRQDKSESALGGLGPDDGFLSLLNAATANQLEGFGCDLGGSLEEAPGFPCAVELSPTKLLAEGGSQQVASVAGTTHAATPNAARATAAFEDRSDGCCADLSGEYFRRFQRDGLRTVPASCGSDKDVIKATVDHILDAILGSANPAPLHPQEEMSNEHGAAGVPHAAASASAASWSWKETRTLLAAVRRKSRLLLAAASGDDDCIGTDDAIVGQQSMPRTNTERRLQLSLPMEQQLPLWAAIAAELGTGRSALECYTQFTEHATAAAIEMDHRRQQQVGEDGPTTPLAHEQLRAVLGAVALVASVAKPPEELKVAKGESLPATKFQRRQKERQEDGHIEAMAADLDPLIREVRQLRLARAVTAAEVAVAEHSKLWRAAAEAPPQADLLLGGPEAATA